MEVGRCTASQLVECVLNFSEGRRKDVIETIANAVRSVEGVTLLDVESNEDHNRCVISFVGEHGHVKDAAMAAARKAIELIDLRSHKGEHPRMGAVDVVPFIPLSGTSMEDCVRLAKEFGREFAEEFQVPVFLYEEAATRPDRHDLADIRSGEFEGLRELIGKDSLKKPDFGPERIHPSAGATAVGAREILIAYNVNLGTKDVGIAKRVAREVRAKDGGLAYVKALGFELKERGIVQVSMNLTGFKRSEMFKAYEMVKLFAARYGIPVVGSEIVGLAPMEALADTAEFYLRLENFSLDQVLEKSLFQPHHLTLTDQSLTLFSEEVASRKPAPGGGSVSAYMGALGGSLVSMVARISLGRKTVDDREKLERILEGGERLRRELLQLVVKDTSAFESLMHARKLPKDRDRQIQEATVKAAEVPLETMAKSVEVLRLTHDIAQFGTRSALSDVITAATAARGAVEGAASNVMINLGDITDSKFVENAVVKVDRARKDGLQLESESIQIANSRLAKPALLRP